MIQLVILDRDGVINEESPHYIKSPEEWHPIPGSLEAIAKLTKTGIKVAIASNQSGIGRGIYNLDALERIHQKMQNLLANLGGHIDMIECCIHHPDNHCACRKPKPTLLYNIATYFQVSFSRTKVPFIGDSLRDLQAAQKAGCVPMLVLTGNGEKTQKMLPADLHDAPIYANLSTAVDALLATHFNDYS